MQAIARLCVSTAITSAPFVSIAILGSSKRLIEHFPEVTKNGLLLSATLGIVAKVVGDRIFSTKNPRVTACLTAARVSLCTILAPQLTKYVLKHPGINLSASCFLFVLSEICTQLITTFVFKVRGEQQSLLEEIRRILPTIQKFEDAHSLANPWKQFSCEDLCINSRRWILWLVRTQAWKNIPEARITANLIQDKNAQSEAFFEIVRAAVWSCMGRTKREIPGPGGSTFVEDPVPDMIQAQRIATAKEIAAAMQDDEWKAKAYLAIIWFEAEKDIQKARATLETARPHLQHAEIMATAIAEDRQTAIQFLASQEITATSFLGLFAYSISRAAQEDPRATMESVYAIKDPFLQMMAKITLHWEDKSYLYRIPRDAELQQNEHCPAPLKSQALLVVWADALARHDREYIHAYVMKWVKQHPGHEINPAFLRKIIRTYAPKNGAIGIYQQELSQIPQDHPLDRAWLLLATAKHLLKTPSVQQVLSDANDELTQVKADTPILAVRKTQAAIKHLKITLKCRTEPTEVFSFSVPKDYQHHVSIEYIKAFATAGQGAKARRMALEIPQPAHQVRALISIMKAAHKQERVLAL